MNWVSDKAVGVHFQKDKHQVIKDEELLQKQAKDLAGVACKCEDLTVLGLYLMIYPLCLLS